MQKQYTLISKIKGGLKSLILAIFSYIVIKNDKLYIFGGNGGNTFSGNSKALFLYYLEKKYNIYYIIKKDIQYIPKDLKKYFIKIGSLKYYYIYLRAKFIFIDGTLGDISPISLIIGKFNIINLWHGDPIKKIWFSNKLHFEKHSFLDKFLLKNLYCKKFKLSFTGNKKSKKHLEEAFNSEHKVTGLARYDVFFSKKFRIENIKNKLNIKKYTKVLLYVPTWRDSSNEISPFSNKGLKNINDYLEKNNYILLIKSHKNTKKINYNNFGNIINISKINIDIQEILNKIDLIITDYSSIYIDFLLTNKPIIFYPYDIKKYLTKDREMYYNYNNVIINSTLSNDENELLYKIKNIDKISKNTKYKLEYLKLKNHFHKYQKGGYCDRINKEIDKL